jgi:transposase-like protein
MLDLTDPIYSDETAARKYIESVRWADGAYCPHCGDLENVYEIGGKSAGTGLWACKSCRKKFTVTVGTLFERSHIKLTKSLAAFHLMCGSKKGISAIRSTGSWASRTSRHGLCAIASGKP